MSEFELGKFAVSVIPVDRPGVCHPSYSPGFAIRYMQDGTDPFPLFRNGTIVREGEKLSPWELLLWNLREDAGMSASSSDGTWTPPRRVTSSRRTGTGALTLSPATVGRHKTQPRRRPRSRLGSGRAPMAQSTSCYEDPNETVMRPRHGNEADTRSTPPAFCLVRERRRRDLNPRTREGLLFSRQVHSAALPRLPGYAG